METESAGLVAGLVMGVICVALMLAMVVAMWKIFVKAGQPGWACLVPLYNAYVLLKIAGKPGWWLILLMIPVVGLIFSILVMLGLASKFGKGAGFAVGMILLFPIFALILAFGDSEYRA